MILADTNFWLALSLSKHPFHMAAMKWFGRQSKAKSVLFCRSTQQSFLRLLTTDAVLKPFGNPPLSNRSAWTVYSGIRSDRRVEIAPQPPHLETQWKAYAEHESASPKLWMDAYLAAFAVAGGHELITADHGFAQFDKLKVIFLTPAAI